MPATYESFLESHEITMGFAADYGIDDPMPYMFMGVATPTLLQFDALRKRYSELNVADFEDLHSCLRQKDIAGFRYRIGDGFEWVCGIWMAI